MDLKKLVPWNWFKKEEEAGNTVPVHHASSVKPYRTNGPVDLLHQEVDQLFDNFFESVGVYPAHSSGFSPFRSGGFFLNSLTEGLLKPTLNIGADDKEYAISIEVPGVDQKDIKLEIANNTLTVRGEKKQEREEKEKNYYRMERSYGSFQRVLSLPEDANHDKIEATFKNGVLKISMPRKALSTSNLKQIPIN